MIPMQQSSLRMFWSWRQMSSTHTRWDYFFFPAGKDEQRIFRPSHSRCKTDWGTLLPAVLAPVWWRTSRSGGWDRRAPGWGTRRTDAPHPLCTLRRPGAWWVKKQKKEKRKRFSAVRSDSKSTVRVRQSASPVQSWATYTTRLWTAVVLATAFLQKVNTTH